MPLVPVSGSEEATLWGGETFGLWVGALAEPLRGSVVDKGRMLLTNWEWVRLMSGRLMLLFLESELRREKRRTSGLKR